MLNLLDPDIINRGGIRCFWKQADVLLQMAFKAGYFHGKTYYNRLHTDWRAGKTVNVIFTECPQQDRILATYRVISVCHPGRIDHRDAICAYLLSLIIREPES